MNNRLHATLYGWLLLLPAMACLVVFTHWPAVASIVQSFFSNARPRRPSHFVGIENYRVMLDDPIFWKALSNNLWFALGTIPSRGVADELVACRVTEAESDAVGV